jgi:hypothetical protein
VSHEPEQLQCVQRVHKLVLIRAAFGDLNHDGKCCRELRVIDVAVMRGPFAVPDEMAIPPMESLLRAPRDGTHVPRLTRLATPQEVPEVRLMAIVPGGFD